MIFYDSFYQAIQELETPEEQAAAYNALIQYSMTGEEPEGLHGGPKIIFLMARPQIDANNERRENGAKGAEYGKLGGRPKKNPIGVIDKNPIGVIEENPGGVNEKTPKVKVKEKEKVKDKEKENIKEREYFPDDEKLEKAFADYIQFRKDIKKPFVNRAQVERCAARLTKLSGGNNDKAISIIEQSISNGWQGLFDLKETARSGTPKKNTFNDFEQRTYDFQELERQLLAR